MKSAFSGGLVLVDLCSRRRIISGFVITFPYTFTIPADAIAYAMASACRPAA